MAEWVTPTAAISPIVPANPWADEGEVDEHIAITDETTVPCSQCMVPMTGAGCQPCTDDWCEKVKARYDQDVHVRGDQGQNPNRLLTGF